MKIKAISCRIRMMYFYAIVDGEKTIEYRPDSPYWRVRLGYPEAFKDERMPRIAVFICGKRVHRRKIHKILRIQRPDTFSRKGQRDVPTPYCYAIYLGDVVDSKRSS